MNSCCRELIRLAWHRNENQFQQQSALVNEKREALQRYIPISLEVASSFIKLKQEVKTQSFKLSRRLQINQQMKKVGKMVKQFTFEVYLLND